MAPTLSPLAESVKDGISVRGKRPGIVLGEEWRCLHRSIAFVPHPFKPVSAIPLIMYFCEMAYATSIGAVEMTVAAMSGP